MLDSLKEFTNSTFNTAIARIKNPAFGAFALSWCAFNWKQLLYLFFADNSIYYKISYISENSNWCNVIIFPAISALFICIGQPWLNNAIIKWQSKPLDNLESITTYKNAKAISRSTKLKRLEAKRDVTYEKIRTGEEKNIQSMKEQITKSQEKMGEITRERDNAQNEKLQLEEKINTITAHQEELTLTLNTLNAKNNELENEKKQMLYSIRFLIRVVEEHKIDIYRYREDAIDLEKYRNNNSRQSN